MDSSLASIRDVPDIGPIVTQYLFCRPPHRHVVYETEEERVRLFQVLDKSQSRTHLWLTRKPAPLPLELSIDLRSARTSRALCTLHVPISTSLAHFRAHATRQNGKLPLYYRNFTFVWPNGEVIPREQELRIALASVYEVAADGRFFLRAASMEAPPRRHWRFWLVAFVGLLLVLALGLMNGTPAVLRNAV